MGRIYDWFDEKFPFKKFMFWFRVFAYLFIIQESFNLKSGFNYGNDIITSNRSLSAIQVSQLANESTMLILHSLGAILTVGLVLIALEVRWNNVRKGK